MQEKINWIKLKEDYVFLNRKVKSFNEYMNVAYKAENFNDEVKSIIHTDNTYRPQYVTKKNNKIYFEQLKEIKGQLGHSVIINTSLNNETPIVYSMEQAIRLFKQKSLSTMVFNNQIIIENSI